MKFFEIKMDSAALLSEKLTAIAGEGNVLEHESMSRHCSFRAGGEARFFVTVQDEEALFGLMKLIEEEALEWFLLGNGSNLLVSDRGYDGIILKLGKGFEYIEAEADTITAGPAALLSRIAAVAAEHSLGGMEFASGIPGSLGGALTMNAGAYGGEMKDIVSDVRIYFCGEGVCSVDNAGMEFGYRYSLLKKKRGIVLGSSLKLAHGDKQEILDKASELNRQRREKQPLEYPSAGSTFKRPQGHFAGKLISDAGCKGMSIGGACVSEKHAGFVINKGNATATDIYSLMCKVQKKVRQDFDVLLEPEVILLGAFDENK